MKFFLLKPVLIAAAIASIGISPAAAMQFGGFKKVIDKANEKAEKVNQNVDKASEKLKDIELTDDEEARLGEQVSDKIRTKYGVVQDPSVHRYVALVGNTVARKSARPGLKWNFIVLDTDGVNAFAAPGGFLFVTRGMLALVRSEDELACVLAHEVAHVAKKHGLKTIQTSRLTQAFTLLGSEAAKGHTPDEEMVKILQNHVKMAIAPYKYPRRVIFTDALPKTQTGKIQRFRLRKEPTP